MSKHVKDNFITLLIEATDKRVVAYSPILAEIGGSAKAGIFLSQLLYWWGKGKDPQWIYKTIAEIEKETHLTRSQQDCAIRDWKRLGVIEVEIHGQPPTRHFHVNGGKLTSLIEHAVGHTVSLPDANAYAESCKSNYGSQQNTTESTSENTNIDSPLQEVASHAKAHEARETTFADVFSDLCHD